MNAHRHFLSAPCASVQIPFFATHETKRKRGYGRALVEAIEEVRPLLGCMVFPATACRQLVAKVKLRLLAMSAPAGPSMHNIPIQTASSLPRESHKCGIPAGSKVSERPSSAAV